MRRPVRLLASAVALLLIASMGLVARPGGAAMDRPTWSTGDFWVYALESASGGVSMNGTLRFDVTGSESVNVNGTSYPTYRIAADLNIPLGGGLNFDLPADLWFSSDTLAIVKIQAVVPAFGNLTTETTIVVAGNPPQAIQWPLTASASWTSSTLVWTTLTNATTTTYSSVSLTTTFEVQSDATITVPAGSFTTTPLKETSANGSYTMNFWSAQVGNWVRVGSYEPTGENTQNFNLTASHYAGGGFLSAVVFGLQVWIWLILIVVILAAIVGVVAIRRRRPPPMPGPMPPPTPPGMPPEEPPMGPGPPGSMP